MTVSSTLLSFHVQLPVCHMLCTVFVNELLRLVRLVLALSAVAFHSSMPCPPVPLPPPPRVSLLGTVQDSFGVVDSACGRRETHGDGDRAAGLNSAPESVSKASPSSALVRAIAQPNVPDVRASHDDILRRRLPPSSLLVILWPK